MSYPYLMQNSGLFKMLERRSQTPFPPPLVFPSSGDQGESGIRNIRLASATAATAAYRVLMAHCPGQKTSLDDIYAIALAAAADPAAQDVGKAIGEAAAIVQTPYHTRTQPGVWVPTALR